MPMTFEEWQAKAGEFPSLGAAEQWRQANGVDVAGLPPPQVSANWSAIDRSAPRADLSVVRQPVTGAQTPAMVAQTPQGQATMNTTGGLPVPSEAEALMTELRAMPAKAEQRAKDRFARGALDIQQMYGGPDTSQMLFALSNALLSPTKYRGFGGTMSNISQALQQIGQQRTSAEQKRGEALANLRASYAEGIDDREYKSLDARTKLLKLQQDAEQAASKRRTGFNPVTGELVDMDSGAPISGGAGLPVLTPEQVSQMSRDPRNRGTRFQTTDGREMEI